MSTVLLDQRHRSERRIWPRSDRIDGRHAPRGRVPKFTLTWDRRACEAGAWRTVVDRKALRVAPAAGLDVDTVLRDVIEGLLLQPDPSAGQ